MRCELAGVGNKDYRQAMAALSNQGWTVRKTNGGHYRLTHPDASMPVFASSTPTNASRSIKNLEAECRRALRPISMIEDIPTSPKRKTNEEPAMSRKRRRKPRHSEVPPTRRNGLVITGLTDTERKSEAGDGFLARSGTGSVSAAAMGVATPGSGPGAPRPQDAGRQRSLSSNGDAEAVSNVDKMPAPENRKEEKMIKAQVVPLQEQVKMVSETGRQIAAASDTGTVDAALLEIMLQVQRGEHDDIMELAARVHRGELKPVTITPDMIGSTLWVSSDATLAKSSATVSDASPDLALPPAQSARFAEIAPFLCDEAEGVREILNKAGRAGAGRSEHELYSQALKAAASRGLVEMVVQASPRRISFRRSA